MLAALDDGHAVPRAVLVRHGWLAVREGRLNVRDAPESWTDERAAATESAAEQGETLLRELCIPQPHLA